jgi:hypothetical protein
VAYLMITWPNKDPDEVVGYSVDWSPLLGADEIATSEIVVVSGAAVISADALDASNRILSVTISGGTDGETTVFRNTITTAGGFTYEETISLNVVSSEFPVGPSTARKRVLIEMAAQELRLASYEFNFTPEEYVAALRYLDGIALGFEGCGYNSPATFGGGEVDDPSGLNDAEVPAFALLLAEACAPMVGKTLGVTATRRITQARIKLAAKYAVLPTVQLPGGYPVGAGARRVNRFTPAAT